MKTIRISRTTSVMKPNRSHSTDAGIDLYLPEPEGIESVAIWPQQSKVFGAGIRIDLPQGFVGLILEKSGIATKQGLLIGAKVIDAGYQGEIHIHVINTTDKIVTVKYGQKIAQLLIIPIVTPTVEEVELAQLYDKVTDRAEGKFGSTGL